MITVVAPFLALAMVQPPTNTPLEVSCPGITTYAMNQCAIADLNAAHERLDRYVDAARERLAEYEDQDILIQFDAAHVNWTQYLEGECGALYQRYITGSIRGLVSADCQRSLIDERTHTVWKNWLTYADSTPPILPEPNATENSNAAE